MILPMILPMSLPIILREQPENVAVLAASI